MLLIGSNALVAYGMLPKGRKLSDVDYVAVYEDAVKHIRRIGAKSVKPINGGSSLVAVYENGSIGEYEIAWPGSRAEKLLRFVESGPWEGCFYRPIRREGWITVAPPELLLALKLSHRFLKDSPHFYKTMQDIRMLRQKGVVVPEAWGEFLKEREKDTYTYKHPDLSLSKAEFFDTNMTGVVQKYDHDSVHEAVALNDKPAYLYYMKEGSPVQCDKEKFFAADNWIRISGVMEEAMVLAIERSLVPHPGVKTPEEAFRFALMKVCTSITSGWFREWAWEWHDVVLEEFLALENVASFWTAFQQQVENGRVKLKEEVSKAKTTWQQLELPLTNVYTVAVRVDGEIQHYQVQALDEEDALSQVKAHFPRCPAVCVV